MKSKLVVILFLVLLILLVGKGVYSIYGREKQQEKHPLILGREYLEKKEFSQALSQFQELKKEIPLIADYADFQIALTYFAQEDFSKAEEDLNKFLLAYPDSVLREKVQITLGETIIKQQNFAKAGQFFNKLAMIYPKEPKIWLKLGEIYENEGSFEKAVYAYRVAQMKSPLSQEANQAHQRLLELSEEFSLPESEFSSKTVYDYAMFFYGKKLYSQAKNIFKEFIKERPWSNYKPTALVHLAICEFKLGDYKNAQRQLLYAKKKYPYKEGDLVFYWLARVYGRLGNEVLAVNNYRKVLMAYPKSNLSQKAFWYLAQYYEEKNEKTKALEFYRRLSRYKKSNLADDALWQMGKIYWRDKNYSRAFSAFSRIAKEFPGADYVDESLFWTAKAGQKLNLDSVSYLEKLIEKFPYGFYAFRARMKLNRMNVSVPSDFSTASSAFPENERVEKAALFVDLELYGEALGELTSFIELNPNFENNVRPLLIKIYKGQKNYYAALKEVEKQLRQGNLSESNLAELFPKAYWEQIQENAEFYGLDPYFIAAIIREESRFNPFALSSSSAYGLMQIIPSTAEGIAKKLGLKNFKTSRLYDSEINLKMGSYYIANLLERFWGNKSVALCAYNGGPNNAKRWLKNSKGKDIDEFIEGITYPETRDYVKKVLASYWNYKFIYEKQFVEKF